MSLREAVESGKFVVTCEVAPPKGVQGSSLFPLLDPSDCDVQWRDHLVAESHGMNLLVSQRMIRLENYKYVYNATDIDEFYDLEEDPWEMDNLADKPEYARIKKRLRAELDRWMAEQNDPGAAMDDPEVHAANRKAGSKKPQ